MLSSSYRGKIVIYDLTKDVRYTLTQKWDRSTVELAVSGVYRRFRRHLRKV